VHVLPKPLDLSVLASELAQWMDSSPDDAAPLPR
jgi:hypothetical protein